MTNHLDSDILAAYGERRLEAKDRALAESHLAECADCRHDLAAVAAVVGPARRRRQLMRATPLLAAAAVIAVVVVSSPGDPPHVAMRPGGEGEGLPVIEALIPAEQAHVGRAALRFVWSSDGPDALYDLRLTDGSGLLLWQATTSDTTIVPPDSVSLGSGTRYFWWVDVLLPDGRLAKTSLQEFTLIP